MDTPKGKVILGRMIDSIKNILPNNVFNIPFSFLRSFCTSFLEILIIVMIGSKIELKYVE